MVECAGAAAFHLFEIVAAPDVVHEEQAFERFDVGARGDHIYGHSDARVVVVSELGEDRFRIFFDLLLGVAYRRASTASAGLREF